MQEDPLIHVADYEDEEDEVPLGPDYLYDDLDDEAEDPFPGGVCGLCHQGPDICSCVHDD